MMSFDPAHTLDPSLLPLLLKRDNDQLRWLWTIATSEVLRHRAEKFCHFVHMQDVDLSELEVELDRTPEEFWAYNIIRKKIEAQRKTDGLPLRNVRYVKLPTGFPPIVTGIHVHEDAETPLAQHYPKTMAFIGDFAESMNSIPSRAMIVRLNPHEQVYAHFDIGFYYLVRDRYHLVLRSPSGSRMRCMDETSVWKTGELWWFNNKVEHEAFNEGDSWRIHLIFDLLPKQLVPLMERIKDFTPYYQDLRASEEAARSFPDKEVMNASFIGNLREQIEGLMPSFTAEKRA